MIYIHSIAQTTGYVYILPKHFSHNAKVFTAELAM